MIGSLSTWGLVIAALTIWQGAAGQSVRSLVNGGNDLYRDQKYTDAEVNYRKALEKEQGLVQGYFNLGDALHKQGKYDEAVKEFESALQKADQKNTKAYAHYNIGNSFLKEQKYQEAVNSYIDALKLNPDDGEAKYNLSYALEKLKQPPPQQNKQKQDKNKDKNDQNKNNQQQQDRKKDQEQQDKQQQQKKNQASQQEKKMSKADAERILDVLKNNEKEVQKKLKVRQAVRAKTDKDW
jgi:tetratricopeptide (TPR) repeat protein